MISPCTHYLVTDDVRHDDEESLDAREDDEQVLEGDDVLVERENRKQPADGQQQQEHESQHHPSPETIT